MNCKKFPRLVSTLIFTVVLAVISLNATVEAAGRVDQPLLSGWRFAFGDAYTEAVNTDDSNWQQVDLPHTWNRVGGYATKTANDNDRKGNGWYRLNFDAPAVQSSGNRAWLQFDGASVVTDIWLNGIALGRHDGGVSGFRFDVTDAIRPGKNLLVVRTDNTDPATPGAATAETIPMSGDWFMYGGLYRKVSLITVNAVHIDLADHGGPGVYAQTLSLEKGRARIAVTTKVRNDSSQQALIKLRAELVNDKGVIVATSTQTLTLTAKKTNETQALLSVTHPRLWNGVPDPYLYKLRVSVLSGKAVLDTVEQDFGIRTIRFDPDQGFFLNGQKLVLKGVSRHQEVAGKGWAASDEDVEKDYALVAELGANTIRLAHYEHSQFSYDIADRMGLIVWAELPYVNTAAPIGKTETTPNFAANAEHQLRELIRQNYNHASIAVWSVANEPNLLATYMPVKPLTLPLIERLVGVAKTEDASRPAVVASCCGTLPGDAQPGNKAQGLDSPPEAVDVFGINIYFGWYYGAATDMGAYLDSVHAHYSGKTFGITEYGAGGALTQHSDNPQGGPINAIGRPQPEEFQSYFHEQSWPQIRARSYLWGSWVWNMFDFGSAQRQEGDLIDTNTKGLISYDRQTRKEAFYYYKAQWNPEPMLYLTGHRYVDRASPVADVKAYSNAPRARLSLNGKDLGSTECLDRICMWRNVALAQGENRLVAEATLNGKTLSDSVTWQRSAGPGTYRILAGQLAVTQTKDGLYGSDNFFKGGQGAFLNPPLRGPAKPPKVVAGASDQRLYMTYRSGQFAYELVLPDGDYVLTLRFTEPVTDQLPGKRVFDVLVQGSTLLKDIDLVTAAGGSLKALERVVPVQVKNGMLRMEFVPKAGEPIISSFSLIPH